MNITTPKTDECIRMLNEATLALNPRRYKGICAKLFEKDEEMDYLKRIMAMLDYRLMPLSYNALEPITPEKANKENLRAFLEKCDKKVALSNIDNLWYVIKNYQLVTAEDLKDEFCEICPDIDSIPKYLRVIREKFNNGEFPDGSEMETLSLDEIKNEYQGLEELIELGKITKQESDIMLIHLEEIARHCYVKSEIIEGIYKSFKRMAEPQQSEEIEQPVGNKRGNNQKNFSDFLTYSKKDELMIILHQLLDNNASGMEVARILEALVDKQYISTNARIVNSAIREFNFRCTGQSINNYFVKKKFTKEEKQTIIDLLP